MKKVLLYSGGMDSWLISKLWDPDVLLYVDMCTKYSKAEIARLPKNVIIEKLDLSKWERPDAIIPLRNLYLIMVATNYGDEICLGATAGDRVLDKSFEFAEKASDLLSFLYSKQHWTEERNIKVNLDFKNLTKKELLIKYLNQGGSLAEAANSSFSCYEPTLDGSGRWSECWQCKPCFRKYVSFKILGHDFGAKVDRLVKEYLDTEIIPSILAGNYGRADEEKDILEVYEQLCQTV